MKSCNSYSFRWAYWLNGFLWLVAVLTLPDFSYAQSNPPKNPLAAIARFLDGNEMLVGWVDIKASSPQDIVGMLGHLEGSSSSAVDLKMLTDHYQMLNQHGVQRVFVAMDPLTGHRGPLFLFPAKDAEGLNGVLAKMPFVGGSVGTRAVDGVVLLGEKERLERATATRQVANRAIVEAAEHVEGPHGIIFAPNAVLREGIVAWSAVVSDQDRDVQAAVDSIAGLRVVTASFRTPLDRLRMVATFESSEQAQKLLPVWREKLESLLDDDSLANLLQPKDRQLVWESQSTEQANRLVEIVAGGLLGRRQLEGEANDLKQVMLALFEYESTHGQFPPQALVDANGRKLLSWRVLILPYLGRDAQLLYKEFHLDEPWDSDHNRSLLAKMPSVYGRRGDRTAVLTPLTADSIFGRPGSPAKFSDIKDGTSVTLMLVRVPNNQAVEWTRPDDWIVPEDNSLASFRPMGNSFLGARADGSVQRFKTSMDDATLRALISRDGEELIEESAIR